jgi:outer membrane lipoprotein-sorting protein
MLAFTMSSTAQGEITFTSIEINPKIDPSAFEVNNQ